MNSSIKNISPIKRIFKMNINSLYHDLKFDEKILEKIDQNKDNKEVEGLRAFLLGQDEQKLITQFEKDNYLNDAIRKKNEKFYNLESMINGINVKKH